MEEQVCGLGLDRRHSAAVARELLAMRSGFPDTKDAMLILLTECRHALYDMAPSRQRHGLHTPSGRELQALRKGPAGWRTDARRSPKRGGVQIRRVVELGLEREKDLAI